MNGLRILQTRTPTALWIDDGRGALASIYGATAEEAQERAERVKAALEGSPAAAPPSEPGAGQARPGREAVVAIYEHRHGVDVLLFATEAEAETWRAELANEWWEREFPGEPKPADPDELRDSYWERIEDESFTIQPVKLPPDPLREAAAEMLKALEHVAQVLALPGVTVRGATGDITGGLRAVADAAIAAAKGAGVVAPEGAPCRGNEAGLLSRAAEYVERFADLSDEPEGGDCRALLAEMRAALGTDGEG